MAEKKYKLSAGANEDLVAKMGYCLASDKITVDGLPVGYMYREEPEEEDDKPTSTTRITRQPTSPPK